MSIVNRLNELFADEINQFLYHVLVSEMTSIMEVNDAFVAWLNVQNPKPDDIAGFDGDTMEKYILEMQTGDKNYSLCTDLVKWRQEYVTMF